jgi:gliding motility-associated-like protein
MCTTANLNIVVTPVNDPPSTVNEVVITPEQTPVNGDLLTAADTDPDGDPLIVNTTPVAGPDNGSIVINSDGTYTYTPNGNYNGNDMVVVEICDNGIPPLCAFDTLFITVTPVNNPPVAVNDVMATDPGIPVSLHIGDNDSDTDGPSLTWNIIVLPDSGTVVLIGDSLIYTPNAGVGTTGPVIDTLIYQVCDNGIPNLCDTAMVIIYIPNSDLPPVVTNEHVTGIEDQLLIIDVLGNDNDPNQDTLTVSPGSGTTPNGSWTVDVNNNIIYQPNSDFNGNDTIIVQVCDQTTPIPFCINDTVFIVVNPVNDPPVVTNDTAITSVNTPVSGDLTGPGESDPDGTILTANVNPVAGPSNGTIVINNDGTFTYTPANGFSGTDTVVVEVCDNGVPQPSICVYDTLFIIINSSLPPFIPDTVVTTPQDSTITFCLDITDPEGNGPFTIGNINCADLGNVSAVINSNQVCITYVPTPGINGIDTICITLCDASSICGTYNPIVNITPFVNTPPVVNDTTVFTPMDSTITFCVPINDAQGNGPYTATIGCADSGTANAVVSGNTVCITFVPNAGYVGTDSLCLIVCDGANSCDTSDMVVVVTPPNNTPPLVSDTTVFTPMDSTITFCVPITDAQGNGPYTATIGCANNGTASAVVTGNIVCITFVPNAGYVGTDSLCLIVCDGANSCDTSNMVVVVTPPNTPPFVNDTTVQTPVDIPITFCVPILDQQGNGPYTATVGCVDNGSANVVITGNTLCITFTPVSGFIGTDSLCVVICDSLGLCDTSVVVVVVTPANIPPVAIPDYATTKIITPVTIPVTLNDYDTDGTINIASVSITQGPAHGTVLVMLDGTTTYTPDAGFAGIDHFIYQISDNDALPLSDTAIVTIVIEPNKISIPSGFSPDGDGTNEYFVIQGLEAYPEASLQIYNRWGNLVYESAPYDNKWQGTSNVGGVLFGANLPEGTYFYMLDLKNDEKLSSGYVILKR